MKRNRLLSYCSLAICFLLVSVIVFVIPTEKSSAFKIAYGFTVAAFAGQIVIWNIALGQEPALKSKFLGFPVLSLGLVYLLLQILILAVFTVIPDLPVWSAIVVCSLLLAVAAVCILSAEIVRGEIAGVDARNQKKVFYLRSLQVDVEMLADEESDPAVKTALQKLAEALRFSDPMSHESLAGLESDISNKISALKECADKSRLIHEITLLLTERNKKAKILK